MELLKPVVTIHHNRLGYMRQINYTDFFSVLSLQADEELKGCMNIGTESRIKIFGFDLRVTDVQLKVIQDSNLKKSCGHNLMIQVSVEDIADAAGRKKTTASVAKSPVY